ncbi:MAG TPA: hypothetical protein VM737_04630 [Gemmatimonadota bacterium]|nr:hypothetical protein [Gemmatimonadota bacterium]
MGRRAIIDYDWVPPISDRPISTRLPTWLDDWLRFHFNRRGEGPSVGLRRVVEEWWTRENYSAIEIREGPRGRLAAVSGGPELWQVIAIWRSSGEKAGLVESAFPVVNERVLEQVLEYAILFSDTIEDAIGRHASVGAGPLAGAVPLTGVSPPT